VHEIHTIKQGIELDSFFGSRNISAQEDFKVVAPPFKHGILKHGALYYNRKLVIRTGSDCLREDFR